MNVMVHGIDQSWKGFVCPEYKWHGRQFTPDRFGCGLCKFGTARQFIPITRSVFEDLAGELDNTTVCVDDLVAAARERVVDDNGFVDQFREYLEVLAEVEQASPADPLWPADEPNHLQQ